MNKNSLSPEKAYTHENESTYDLRATPTKKVELPAVKGSLQKVLNRLEEQSKRIAAREKAIKKRLAENRMSNSFDRRLDSSF